MKIGELAMTALTPVETIRYYEREGLLPKPGRSDGNYRIYEAQHLEHLQFIRHCRSLDMSLAEVRELLMKNSLESCGNVNRLLDEHISHVSRRIRELRQLEKQLKVAAMWGRRCKTIVAFGRLAHASQTGLVRRKTQIPPQGCSHQPEYCSILVI
jgi:Cd(II)/Pb(II)-responsive transcriptional regulator